jgi:hypothetical protein
MSTTSLWAPFSDDEVDTAARLLAALRAAGCDCFVDPEDDQFYCSPPARRIEWDEGDPEEALELHRAELRELVRVERMTIH